MTNSTDLKCQLEMATVSTHFKLCVYIMDLKNSRLDDNLVGLVFHANLPRCPRSHYLPTTAPNSQYHKSLIALTFGAELEFCISQHQPTSAQPNSIPSPSSTPFRSPLHSTQTLKNKELETHRIKPILNPLPYQPPRQLKSNNPLSQTQHLSIITQHRSLHTKTIMSCHRSDACYFVC